VSIYFTCAECGAMDDIDVSWWNDDVVTLVERSGWGRSDRDWEMLCPSCLAAEEAEADEADGANDGIALLSDDDINNIFGSDPEADDAA
jgi:hypothetical protein